MSASISADMSGIEILRGIGQQHEIDAGVKRLDRRAAKPVLGTRNAAHAEIVGDQQDIALRIVIG